ncbi:MAG TPA: SDR family oxidoreductase [Candidatus Norongarragalinales archaeon]|nr:SDR family oxidoreductase [Candidatus Norongarragalinales archaeon]
MNLEGKTVVITGASRGFGEALAKAFAKKRANVLISARSESELQQLAKKLKCGYFKADVTKQDEMNALAEKAKEKFGAIDVWVNNAGIFIPKAGVGETDWPRAHEMMETNFFGMVYGCLAALPQMRKQGSGVIMNVLSTASLEGKTKISAYSATKFAAKGFTESLRLEEKESGIQVFGIYPGGMQTHLFDEGKPDGFGEYMDPVKVARKVIKNLEKEKPKLDLIIRRPKKKSA